jgi:hypothetical protein
VERELASESSGADAELGTLVGSASSVSLPVGVLGKLRIPSSTHFHPKIHFCILRESLSILPRRWNERYVEFSFKGVFVSLSRIQ